MGIMKEHEYHEHVQTYRGFIKGATICGAVVIVVLAIMAMTLA